MRKRKKANPNRWRAEIERIMDERGVTQDKMAKLMNREYDSIFNKSGGFPSSESEQKPLTRDRLALLYFILKFDPSKFLLKNEEEAENIDIINDNDITGNDFTPAFWNEIKRIWNKQKEDQWKIRWYPLTDRNEKQDISLLRAYLNILDYFRTAASHIDAHEQLFKGDNQSPGSFKDYHEAQGKLLKTIEELLMEKHQSIHPHQEFKYSRTFYLSQDDRLFRKDKGNLQEKRWAFMAEASEETLKHVLLCIRKFSDICSFQISPACRFHSMVNIDNKLVFIEDYLAFGASVLPDRLSIIEIKEDKEIFEMLKHLKSNINKELEIIKITNEKEFFEDLKFAIGHIEQQIDIRKKALQRLLYSQEDSTFYKNLTDKISVTQKTYELHLDHLKRKLDTLMKEKID